MPIRVAAIHEGAAIAFPYDAALAADIKQRFPKARWNAGYKRWEVPGKFALTRAQKWVVEVEHARERERRDAEAEGRLREIDPAAALEARKAELPPFVWVRGNRVVAKFKYDAGAAQLAGKVPSADFNQAARSWSWTAATIADVELIFRVLRQIDVALTASRAEENSRSVQRAAESAATDAENAKVGARGFIVKAQGTSVPTNGETLRRHGKVVTVEGLSRAFRGGGDLSSAGSPVGCEGELVRYVYHRDATREEIAALEVRETAEKTASELLKAHRNGS